MNLPKMYFLVQMIIHIILPVLEVPVTKGRPLIH